MSLWQVPERHQYIGCVIQKNNFVISHFSKFGLINDIQGVQVYAKVFFKYSKLDEKKNKLFKLRKILLSYHIYLDKPICSRP